MQKNRPVASKNELTSGAYGGFVQAYGEIPLALLAWGLLENAIRYHS